MNWQKIIQWVLPAVLCAVAGDRMAAQDASKIQATAQEPVDCVDPFIGTTNFGACNPGAVTPNGMMSVSLFAV